MRRIWFNGEKGLGFIASDDGSADLFVEDISIEGSNDHVFRNGRKAEFDMGLIPKGRHAHRVRRL